MPLFMIVGYRYVKSINRYFKKLPAAKVSWAEFRRIIAIGLPIAGQMVIEVTSFAFSAVMMGWIGDVPLAAHQVAMGMASFTFMIANGVAMAVTIRVSYQLGLKDFASMEKVAFSSVHLVLAYMSLCGLAFMLLKFQLPKLFTPDPEVIVQAAALLMVAALFQFFDGLQVVCLGILRGFTDVKIPMLIAGISYLLIGLPVSYLFAFVLGYGPEGIWFGFVAGLPRLYPMALGSST
jgi:MATE family multidrug resistance protein